MLSALNAASTGTHALENAANTVSGIIGDLDTTILFATAGTLNPDETDEAFAGNSAAFNLSFLWKVFWINKVTKNGDGTQIVLD